MTTPKASSLPKTYQLEGLTLYFTVGGLVVLGLGCVGAAWWSNELFPTSTGREISLLLLSVFGVGMILLAYAAAKEKVVLYHDRIEKTGVFGSRTMAAHQIEGFRNAGRTQQIRLIPKSLGAKAMMVPGSVLQDGVGLAWIDSLKDMDAADLRASEESVLSDSRFGSTRGERAAYLSDHREHMKRLSWVGWGLFAWGVFWPYPYTIVIAALVAAPLLACAVLMWGQLLAELRGDRSAELAAFGMVIVPALALALRALFDISLIDSWPMFSAAIVVAVAFAAGAAWRYPLLRTDASTVIAIGMFGMAYFAGAFSHANVLLDQVPATRFETQIRDKHATSGKHTQYKLTVDSWGEEQSGNDVTVGRALYDQVNRGDMICVYVSPGWLGWRWYAVDHCPRQ